MSVCIRRVSSSFQLSNPITSLWSTRRYSGRHLRKMPCTGSERGTMWLSKQTTYHTTTAGYFLIRPVKIKENIDVEFL